MTINDHDSFVENHHASRLWDITIRDKDEDDGVVGDDDDDDDDDDDNTVAVSFRVCYCVQQPAGIS